MRLPDEKTERHTKVKSKSSKWLVILCIFTLLVSLASAGFSAFVYFNTPSQIHNYVESHKNELKGDKGESGRDGYDGANGRDGANGYNGSNSYAPTHCNTYDYSFGSSTSCY